MHEIDASFRKKKQQVKARKLRERRHRVLAVFGVLTAFAACTAAWWTADRWWPNISERTAEETPPEEQVDEPAGQSLDAVFVPTIVDLAGDPLLINLGQTSESAAKLREIDRPAGLNEPGVPERIEILADTMLASNQRIMALPSSPEDFAFFQSQSARGRPVRVEPASPDADPTDPGIDVPVEGDEAPAEGEAAAGETEEVLVPVAGQDDLEGSADEEIVEEGIPTDIVPSAREAEAGDPGADMGAGWGETVAEGQEALPGFEKTRIEDTTTVHRVKRDVDRFKATEDFRFAVKGERPLESIVAEYGFSVDDGRKAAEAAKKLFSLEKLGDGFLVSLRGRRSESKEERYRLVQISINAPDKYVGTLALSDAGDFVVGVDPWVDDAFAPVELEQAPVAQQFRLLDAIYSTAARNQVPSAVTGEAIMLISRAFDLQALASQDDRLVLVYSSEPRDQSLNAGRVLYVAIRGGEKSFECFVYQAAPGAGFSCMTEKNDTQSVTVTNGMVTPVTGVLTSTFGPRKHPILKQVRIHKGVDWAAPIGTPIMAAFDGTVEFAGDGKGYGNVVRVAHGDGRVTAYAHMSRFEPGLAVGKAVTAGDVIGYVGTTGLSTGPHLHFELYLNGTAIDPLAAAVAVAAISSDGSAVEKLVNRIIHVESGGNARAKNPLSSAAGLGQFIKSTWIRMMKTYRPDLYNSLSTEELLELRYEPTIAREMVTHLARESEARLKARGHQITAGRLYLAHFLGVEGAHTVLSSPGNAMLVDVMGQGVISANPFLTGKDAAYVIAWAERKMSGKAPAAAPAAPTVTTRQVVRTSPEFARYRETMIKLVETVAL